MAARQETHEDFGAALDRITARLAHPLAALDIPVDLGIGEPLEGDDGIGDPHARAPVGAHDADPRQDMMPPPRQQAEHPAQIGLVGRLFEDAAADRDSRSEEHTSELPSLMRISYAVFCLKKK